MEWRLASQGGRDCFGRAADQQAEALPDDAVVGYQPHLLVVVVSVVIQKAIIEVTRSTIYDHPDGVLSGLELPRGLVAGGDLADLLVADLGGLAGATDGQLLLAPGREKRGRLLEKYVLIVVNCLLITPLLLCGQS